MRIASCGAASRRWLRCEYVKTGNSIDVVLNTLEKLVKSKKGRAVLVIVVGLIGGKILYDSHRTTNSQIANSKAAIELIYFSNSK